MRRATEKFHFSKITFVENDFEFYLKFPVENYFFVCIVWKIHIFVGLKAFFSIAKAIVKLAGGIQNACSGAKRLCERRILHLMCFVQATVQCGNYVAK